MVCKYCYSSCLIIMLSTIEVVAASSDSPKLVQLQTNNRSNKLGKLFPHNELINDIPTSEKSSTSTPSSYFVYVTSVPIHFDKLIDSTVTSQFHNESEVSKLRGGWNSTVRKSRKLRVHSCSPRISIDVMIIVVIFCVIFISSIVGNSLVIMTILQNAFMRTPTNMFLLNLAVADLLRVMICLPSSLTAVLFRCFFFGPVLCHVISYLQPISVSASAFTLVVIAIERYCAICQPFRSRAAWQTRRHSATMILLVWFLSCLVNVPFGVWARHSPMRGGGYNCHQGWPIAGFAEVYFPLQAMVMFVGPFTIMTVLYILVIRSLRHGIESDMCSVREKRRVEKKQEEHRRRSSQTNHDTEAVSTQKRDSMNLLSVPLLNSNGVLQSDAPFRRPSSCTDIQRNAPVIFQSDSKSYNSLSNRNELQLKVPAYYHDNDPKYTVPNKNNTLVVEIKETPRCNENSMQRHISEAGHVNVEKSGDVVQNNHNFNEISCNISPAEYRRHSVGFNISPRSDKSLGSKCDSMTLLDTRNDLTNGDIMNGTARRRLSYNLSYTLATDSGDLCENYETCATPDFPRTIALANKRNSSAMTTDVDCELLVTPPVNMINRFKRVFRHSDDLHELKISDQESLQTTPCTTPSLNSPILLNSNYVRQNSSDGLLRTIFKNRNQTKLPHAKNMGENPIITPNTMMEPMLSMSNKTTTNSELAEHNARTSNTPNRTQIPKSGLNPTGNRATNPNPVLLMASRKKIVFKKPSVLVKGIGMSNKRKQCLTESPLLRQETTALRSNVAERSWKSKQRVIRMMIVIVAEFFICWVPLYTFIMIKTFVRLPWSRRPELYIIFSSFLMLAFISSCTNPITYCFMNKRFRTVLYRSFCGSKTGQNGAEAAGTSFYGQDTMKYRRNYFGEASEICQSRNVAHGNEIVIRPKDSVY